MESKKLERTEFSKLVGNWKTEGRILKTDESPEMKIVGTDTYEVILGGFFILHKADVMMGSEQSQTFEMMSWNEASKRAKLQHYNNQGSSGTMTATLDDDELKIDGDELRFRGRLDHGGNRLTGQWEKLEGSSQWKPFLEMLLSKVS